MSASGEHSELTPRQIRRGWLVVAAFVAMVLYVAVSHAHPEAAVIRCPFRALTGFSCFGCGMTRATALALHADMLGSVRFHPFGIVFLLGFFAAATHHLVQNVRGRRLDYGALRLWHRISRPAWALAAGFLLLFGLVRFGLEIAGILTPV